jgi:hypothetical protein
MHLKAVRGEDRRLHADFGQSSNPMLGSGDRNVDVEEEERITAKSFALSFLTFSSGCVLLVFRCRSCVTRTQSVMFFR